MRECLAISSFLVIISAFLRLEIRGQKLRYVQMVWRHGDRAPLEKPYPGDPHDEEQWPRGWGQLTTVGMQQMRELGQFLRRRYAGTFLSADFERKEVLIRATAVDRAIESAQSLLSGMFPPESEQQFVPQLDWQPIAVHSAESTKKDPLLNPWKFPCQRHLKLLQPIREKNDRRLLGQYPHLVDFVSPFLGIPNGQPVKMMELMRLRHIMPEIIHNLTQPEWVSQRWPEYENKTTMELIWAIRAQNWLPIFNGSEEITKLMGGVLLADLLGRAQQIARGEEQVAPAKMIMYSAHDATLLVLLSVLKVLEPADHLYLPPYASCIIMELFEGEEGDEFYVKLLYRRNEQLEDIVLDGCTANCSLGTLVKLAEPMTIHGGEQELRKLCAFNEDGQISAAGGTIRICSFRLMALVTLLGLGTTIPALKFAHFFYGF